MIRRLQYVCLFLCLLKLFEASTGPAKAHDDDAPAAAEAMREAASAWLETLQSELRQQATFAFDGSERTDWHFIPKERTGVSLREMSAKQRRAAHELLRSALSDKGYLKATTIMSLESVLRIIEADREDILEWRNPEKYWFAVYGDPAGDGAWGWRVEGHHLSLNFTSDASTVVATFPAFLGANPAEVRDGPRVGLRVLGLEEDLPHELIRALSEQQRRIATLEGGVPSDVILAPGGELDFDNPIGLPVSDMSEPQAEIVEQIVELFARNFQAELADEVLDEVERAGVDNIYFTWAGELGPEDRHYYRLHGPTFVIEYDKTDPNHVHLVWHSTANNFGADALKRHYQEAEHHSAEAH